MFQKREDTEEEWEEALEEEDWREAALELRAGFLKEALKKPPETSWEQTADEYRYGWTARRRRRGGSWSTHEAEIRREWEENVAETGRSWEDVRENVHRGWEKGK